MSYNCQYQLVKPYMDDIMITSEKLDQILKAMLSIQNEFISIKRETKGEKGRYASYEQLISKAKPAMTKAGLVLLQPVDTEAGVTYIKTYIIHAESSQYIASVAPLTELEDVKTKEGKSIMNNLQRLGSAISYIKRYHLISLLSWATGEYDIDEGTISARDDKDAFIIKSFNDLLKDIAISDTFKTNILEWAEIDNTIDVKRKVFKYVKDIVIPKAISLENEDSALKLFQVFVHENI